MFEEVLKELGKRQAGSGGRSDGEERDRGRKEAATPFQELPEADRLRACFVDGGNAPVFESPEARVEYIRVYATVYDGKERQATAKEEGLLLARTIVIGGKEAIELIGYPPLDFSLTLPDDAAGLAFGKERVALGTAAGVARFLLECRFLTRVGEEHGCSLLVRDGSLLRNNAYEERALQELFATGKNVAGLSKTNTKLEAGRSVTATLLAAGPGDPWLVPLEREERILVGVVKLHRRSEYAFRLDSKAADSSQSAGNGDRDAADSSQSAADGNRNAARSAQNPSLAVAAYLASLSSDPVFPGYPYPLIEADRMARVTNRELDALKMRFRAEAGTKWEELERLSHGSDAHGVLDRIG